LFLSNLAFDINFIIQQTSTIVQEPSVTPRDALPDSGVPVLLLTSSSTLVTDEIPLIQVRHFIFPEIQKGNIQLTSPSS
jgi:hypothetical protein